MLSLFSSFQSISFCYCLICQGYLTINKKKMISSSIKSFFAFNQELMYYSSLFFIYLQNQFIIYKSCERQILYSVLIIQNNKQRMIDREVQVKGKTIKISQDLSLSHAGTVWDGALCQIAYLNKNPEVAKQYIEGKTVLQLGSGTGILGLSAATFHPKEIYLTDMSEYLHLIELNKQKNSITLAQESIHILPLQWGNFSHIQKLPTTIDTIIGSQLAYDKGCVQQLMKTLSYYRKQNPKLKIMISYQKYREQGKNMQKQLSKYFGPQGYGLVQWGKMDYDYRDEGIGIVYVE